MLGNKELNGILIAIEGLDGSGKATQSKLLADALSRDGGNVRQISFPNYESDSSALVKMYLNGEFGSGADDVNAYAASAFYAVDRYASYKTDWGKHYESGGTVVADRYVPSNMIHQMCKLDESCWEDFLDWLTDFEYCYLQLPEPDVVVYLRVDEDVSQKLMSERYSGDESKKDIHEKNVEYQNRARKAADFCAKVFDWIVVDCTKDGKMRTIEEIADDVITAVYDNLPL